MSLAQRKLHVELKDEDRRRIDEILRKPGNHARTFKRALTLDLLDRGYSSNEIAPILRVTPETARRRGWMYVREGLERALYDAPRPGAERLLTEKQSNRIVAMVCSKPPEGNARWTIELIVEESKRRKIIKKVGRETIRVLLHTHDLKPWREDMWCIKEKLDEEFIENMEDVLDISEKALNPKEPVVCMDEKSVQLLSDSRAVIPAKPGRIQRRDCEYVRRGTANIFFAVEPKAGRHITKVTKNRKGKEFAKFIAEIARKYPDAKTIHLIMDNLNTHRLKSLTNFYGDEKGAAIWNRFTVHYTPKHGSWLNQAEIEIGVYSRRCLGKRRIGDIETIISETRAWNKDANRRQAKINWTFTTAKARIKFKYSKIRIA